MPVSRSRRWVVKALASASAVAASRPFSALAQRRQRTHVEFIWSGAVTASSATVKARLGADGVAVRLLVSEHTNLSQPIRSDVATPDMATNGRTVAFPVTGLRPDTRYHYGLEIDEVADTGARGRFRTFADGPYSFSFIFGSCAATGSASPVFDRIRSLDPHFFLHLGDFHYLNIAVNDRDAFRDGYGRVLRSRTQSALYRAVPIVYTWDDHDYGPNDSDKFAPGREASCAVYRECVPHYPLPSTNGAVYQAFDIGRARVILTDTHSERDSRRGPTRTIMGPAQMQWFLDELTRAATTRALVIWANTDPWIAKTGETGDGWAPYCDDRRTIARHIAQVGLVNRFLIVSGDAHMLAIDDGTHSNYATDGCDFVPGVKAFPVFQAAAFDRMGSVKGGPYTTTPIPGRGHFGRVEVIDNGADPITVKLTGHDYEDGELMRLQLTYPLPNVGGGSSMTR
ncbi:MAG: alkaline phosphatase D family protein [Acidobacteria bacterium]|jgi:phosphodiesterase/alkaline phosphatase D-like protein|nr:alkaline phosphatase D family protein [Acidobacteriota bacterium]